MTSSASRETGPAQEAPQAGELPLYYISFERLAALKRSPVVLLAERRVPACPSLQRPDQELADPQALVEEIAEYCGDDSGFIRSQMALQEIIFRTLLARSNQPTSLDDLHYELTERWSTPVRPIMVTKEGLRRILEADDYYGFARSSPEN